MRVDDAALQQVLLNLLLNAVQASPQGGEVRVRVVRGDPVRIRIADDGCGIAREDQKRIFEPFCSLRRGGTGLGLFLSLNFARGWGGDIRVESDLGRGSVFEILIPEAAPASPLAVAPASSPAAERLSNVAPGHAAVKETP
ncbi:MAG: ATP-binding protein [Candidatus Eisenbacteria bacterium]|nr:ATP-binding protein [Candidatus Eisenbacteria bacterium]